MSKIENNNVFQILIVVRDVDKAAKELSGLFGIPVPPAVILDPEEIAHGKYRGKPTRTRAKIIPFKMGSIDVELIQPDKEPSIWNEILETRGEGVCHMGIKVKDVNETVKSLEAKGVVAAQRADFPGGRYAIMDTFKDLGINLMVKQGG